MTFIKGFPTLLRGEKPTLVICGMFYRNQTHLGKKSKLSWLLIMKSRDLQLYNDSFLILIGLAKAGLCNF